MTPEGKDKGAPWLDDPDAPPSEEELRAIAGLEGELAGDDADLAEALKSAHSPKPLDRAAHERILGRAVLPQATKKAPRGLRIVFASSVILAAAAGAVLVLSSTMKRASEPAPTAAAMAAPVATIALVPRRSAQDLFDEPFPREGGESARVDRIASAREHDLRQNRFASWGVR